ncbi:MAG: beta-L-arabinofuranosidase domain-containing protein [Fimbriimonadales bacterium]
MASTPSLRSHFTRMASPWNVRLEPGPFQEAMEANGRYLLRLEPERLLQPYYVAAGLPATKEAYGGWERATIAGHSLGHYLSACCWHFASSGDERFLQRVSCIVAELRRCQSARSDGYVGGVPESDRLWGEIRRGVIRSQGFDLNGIWVPWYNLHKLFQGLIDAAELCGQSMALEVLTDLANWACEVTSSLDEEQWQRMLACEFGGMNDVLAHAYELTGCEAWLDLAKKFDHKAVMDPLERDEDVLPGLHGNTQVPKVLGAARLYRITGVERYRKIAENFFRQAVFGHAYAIGGVTSGEYFGPTGLLSTRLTMSTAETCKTYNLIRLAHAISAWSPESWIDDYVERALWNHILTSQDRETGMFCYFVSLHPGHFNTYSTPEDSFWCCVGTGMENHARYGESLYRLVGERLQVCQYIPSRFVWEDAGLVLRLESMLPTNGGARLVVVEGGPAKATIELRCPDWLTAPLQAACGRDRWQGEPGGWLAISRVWKAGEELLLDLPMGVRWLPTPDDPSCGAIAHGPIVLAGDLGAVEADPPAPFSSSQYAYFGVSVPPVPVLVTDGRPVEEWIEPLAGGEFRTVGVGRPHDVQLKPFFQTSRRRYSVYWRLLREDEYEEQLARLEEERRREEALRAGTIDFVQLGEMQPEREHAVQGEKTEPMAMAGEKMRLAWHGGWFTLKLSNPGGEPASLVVRYWGADGRNREFDVEVNGVAVAHEDFNVADHNQFLQRTYRLPDVGAESVEVTFRGREGKIVGPVCWCRLVREQRSSTD